MAGPIRFPLVDSLRAIGALAVLGTHAGAFAGLYQEGSGLGPYVTRLDAGVTVFFLVSGFLLYRPFVQARVERLDRPRTKAYAWRRFLRITPAYWFALTFCTVAFSLPFVFTPDGILTFYGFGQGYRKEMIGEGLGQAWSLTVEVAFYAFLPLFAWVMSRFGGADREARLRTEYVALGVMIVVSLLYKILLMGGPGTHIIRVGPGLIALPAYLDQFALGMLLAVVTVAVREGRDLPAPLALVARRPWLPWLVALAAFVLVAQVGTATFYAPVSANDHLARHLLYGVIAFGLLLPAVVGQDAGGLVRRFMASRVMVYLGLVSYGIFLWNLQIVGKLSGRGAGDWLPIGEFWSLLVVGLAVTTLVASGSWYLIEKPALSFKGRVPRRRREVSVERAA